MVIDDSGRGDALRGTYIVYSDVQGRDIYLDRFFRAINGMICDKILCLGDIVKFLALPSDDRCIDLARENTDVVVRGNHEYLETEYSAKVVKRKNLEYIANLPDSTKIGNVLLFHSSVSRIGTYLLTTEHILEEGRYIQNNFPGVDMALFGHTHKNGVYSIGLDGIKVLNGDKVKYDPARLTMVNPGGIGVEPEIGRFKRGMRRTFARVNTRKCTVEFFTLEEAELLAYAARVVNSFDRWMDSINVRSYHWFALYAEQDAFSLRKGAEKVGRSEFESVANVLESFDVSGKLKKMCLSKVVKYLEEYSLKLAESLNGLKEMVDGIYNIKDPLEIRKMYGRHWDRPGRGGCRRRGGS